MYFHLMLVARGIMQMSEKQLEPKVVPAKTTFSSSIRDYVLGFNHCCSFSVTGWVAQNASDSFSNQFSPSLSHVSRHVIRDYAQSRP